MLESLIRIIQSLRQQNRSQTKRNYIQKSDNNSLNEDWLSLWLSAMCFLYSALRNRILGMSWGSLWRSMMNENESFMRFGAVDWTIYFVVIFNNKGAKWHFLASEWNCTAIYIVIKIGVWIFSPACFKRSKVILIAWAMKKWDWRIKISLTFQTHSCPLRSLCHLLLADLQSRIT